MWNIPSGSQWDEAEPQSHSWSPHLTHSTTCVRVAGCLGKSRGSPPVQLPSAQKSFPSLLSSSLPWGIDHQVVWKLFFGNRYIFLFYVVACKHLNKAYINVVDRVFLLSYFLVAFFD